MTKRGVRDQMVIATKYTTLWRTGYGNTEIMYVIPFSLFAH